jgi:hypothetical protein
MSDEMEALKRRIEELEAKVNPPASKPFVPQPRQHYDPTEGATNVVTPWMLEMARAVPTSLVRDIVNDFRGGPTVPKPLVPPSEEPAPAQATTVPLGLSPHVKYVDAVALGFAERERAEAIAHQLDIARKLKGL